MTSNIGSDIILEDSINNAGSNFEETKEKVKRVLALRNHQIDVILSHTCPYKYLPREMFLQEIQNVDNTTEYFLDEIDNETEYQDWYCGHFHTDKKVKKLTFMYNDIKKF